MRILVTLAPVSGTRGADGGGRTHALGEWNASAVEAALRTRERSDGVEVVTATVGPPESEAVVRAALATGADRAVRVWDERLDAVDLLDPRSKARLLAAVAADLDPTLVFAGAQSGPDGFAATGVALAARLDYGWAAGVTDLSLDRESGVVSVRRALEGNLDELSDVELPAVLTVGAGCHEPRHTGLQAVRAAHRADIELLSLSDLGLSQADLVSPLRRVGTAERDADVTLFEGDPAEAAADLAAVLRGKGVEP